MKKYGFSLSEVMVTLVVIGVIAVLVVPNVIDSSTAKLNIAAANKAKMDVHQAAMRIQAECPRWHGCTQTDINNKLKAYLKNNGDVKYKFKSTSASVQDIIVDADSDGATDLHYTLNSTGVVTEDTGNKCDVASYKSSAKSACTDTNIKTFSAASDYSSGS